MMTHSEISKNLSNFQFFLLAIESNAAIVALDAGNPWATAPAIASEPEEDNWANFSKADFDTMSNATPMEISDSPSTGKHYNIILPEFLEKSFVICYVLQW